MGLGTRTVVVTTAPLVAVAQRVGDAVPVARPRRAPRSGAPSTSLLVDAGEARDRGGHGLDDPVGGDEHRDRAGVVDERAELRLLAVGDLVPAALGQVAEAQRDGSVADRGTDELDEPPALGGADPDLDRVARHLLLHGRHRQHDALEVVGVHQLEAGRADDVGERDAEGPLRGRVRPGDGRVGRHHDDRVGEQPGEIGDVRRVHGPPGSDRDVPAYRRCRGAA